MMIAFAQGMQRNSALYGTAHANKNATYTYSNPSYVQPHPSSQQYSFARAINEVRDISHPKTPMKSEVKNKDSENNKKSTDTDNVNTVKNADKQMAQVAKHSSDKKKLQAHRANDEHTRKVSANEHNKNDDENVLEHIHVQELQASKKNTATIRHAGTHEKGEFRGSSENISLHAQNAKNAEVEGKTTEPREEDSSKFTLFEKQAHDTLHAADHTGGQEDKNATSVSMQNLHSHTDGESETFLENAHRNIRGKTISAMHAETDINAKKEEQLSHVTDTDEFTHDEDAEHDSNEQQRLTRKSEKHAQGKLSSEMMVHDDGKEKSQFFKISSDAPLDALHEKKNFSRSIHSSGVEKKGLRYLAQHGNQQLVQDVKLLFRENSTGDIRVQLNPKELGDVKLTVKLHDNNLVHANAIVSSEDAKDLMQKNLSNLARHFNSEGYEIGSFSVSVNTEHSDTSEGTRQFSKRHAQRDKNVRIAEIEQTMRSYVRVCQSVDFVA